MVTPSYARYHARDWAENKTVEEITEEITRVTHKARTHHYQWNEVGNVTADWARVDTLREILQERGI